jgi:3-oxoacyl-[acyl-carrier protein] reductase
MEKFMDKVILLTGGPRGLGWYSVLEFAKQGYSVAFTYNSSKADAAELGEILKSLGCHYFYARVDVSVEQEVADFTAEVLDSFNMIDVLVNNAGIFENSLIPDMSLESWNQVLAVNLTGNFLCIKHVFPIMKNQRFGRILSMCSVMAETGIQGSCSYAASKAGVIGLIKSAALEGARWGITANAVSIGLMDEGMSLVLSNKARDALKGRIPMNRAGSADDLAKILVHLSGEEMNYVTGQVIRFNGGMYM